MSRSGYSDDLDDLWQHIRWRGAVQQAIKGARGQAFLREMIKAFDAMPVKQLVASELEDGDLVCAVGAVGRARGVDMSTLNPEDYEGVADKFGIARAMAQEIFFLNDEYTPSETPEQRYASMYGWAKSMLDPAYD